MTRIAALNKPYTEEIQSSFDRVMGAGVPPLLLFTTLARSRRAWNKFTAGALLDGKLLTLRQRELVIDRCCALTGCEYEWGVHVTTFGKAAGLSREEVRATLDRPLRPEVWSLEEAALLTTVDALHERATLSDEEFARLRVHFDDEQVLEIFMLAGFYRTVAYLANGLDLPVEQGAARFNEYLLRS
ncbi:carboxymuconolactone decarboxylase family protein [Pseudomonas sp. zfem001]|uniref:carboxymuconolactone decarboxylase family protein n=1 Tax=Pseudomonas sp. zfem001 TaxID=3078196 RepID=UPI00292787B0|nr:carboxymuconolactone decarboxylase family protein [Pseudomonas sp. zfem001]MDU9408292.1 carboxymuconolactone decarboxylase family protein [Pseudomonas sp. zfem001]